MRYFLSVGEASGDIHAADLIKELAKLDSDATFSFFGGDLMKEAAAADPIIDYRQMAFMGFSEVLRHLPQVAKNMRKAKNAIATVAPDALILVDYPSFNLKLAKIAHRKGIPVYYYISPKVWAWKEYRVKQIKRHVRCMFSIFPFEEDFYRKHGYSSVYVGNPSVEEIDRHIAGLQPREEFIRKFHLADKPIIALVPGSRRGEIRNNLPVMVDASVNIVDYYPVIAAAPGIDRAFYRNMTSLPIVENATFDLIRHSEAALVTSGTATLETALLGTPQVVCYRANGSKLSYSIFKQILKIPFVSLPNLIAGKEIVPEMLLHHCHPADVHERLRSILIGGCDREAQLEGYSLIRSLLGTHNAAATTASSIVNDLKQQANE